MINLSQITLVCVDCVNYYSAKKAIEKSTENINFGEVLFFTDIDFQIWKANTVIIPKITNKEQYSNFIFSKLVDYIKTDYVLIIQYDGYVINPNLWNDEFFNYDYIGAAWWHEERNVGNGGFSLRSKKLLDTLRNYIPMHPEDDIICRLYRKSLEEIGIKFAPEELAIKFSYEPNRKYLKQPETFGFHGIPRLILR